MKQPLAPELRNPSRKHHWAGGVVLGIAMALANVLSYAFLLVLSRSLGPSDFGAFSALNNYSMLLTIPAGAIQLVLARRVASGEPANGTASAAAVGSCLALFTVVLAPVIAGVLRTGSVLAVVLLAGMLLSMSLTGVHLGVLLGQRRFGLLAALYVIIAGGRLAAAAGGAHLGADVTGMIGLVLVSSLIAVAFGVATTRGEAIFPFVVERGLLRDTWRGLSTLAALLALTSVDVILARIVLSDHESGLYALAAIFGKAVFWGTQFLALYVVPAIHTGGRRTIVLRVVVVAAVLGLSATLVAAIFPSQLIALSGGRDYADASGVLVLYTALGTLWGCSQVLLFGDIAQRRRALTRVAWLAVATESVLILTVMGRSPYHVVSAAILAALTVVLAGVIFAWRHARATETNQGALLAGRDGVR